jgi:cell division protein FtsQ
VLPETTIVKAPDVPVLRGGSFLKSIEKRQKAISILKNLPETGPMSFSQVAEIEYYQESYWARLVSNSVKIHLGVQNLPKKIERIDRVMNYLKSSKLDPRVIDADFSKKLVVKLRKHR